MLTLQLDCSMMFACLRDTNNSQSVIEYFDVLERKLGLDTFRKMFPLILTDNGPEFKVWATDITYTKVSGCKAFVIAIIDLYSRKTLAYNVVNTMDTYSCVETLLLAMTRYGIPEISIRIRAASSPARSSRMNSRRMASESAWMAGADAGTMPGWNGSGGR